MGEDDKVPEAIRHLVSEDERKELEKKARDEEDASRDAARRGGRH